MRDGELVGIITRADLVRALVQKLGELEPPQPRSISVDEALQLGREEAIANASHCSTPSRAKEQTEKAGPK
jgi:hypothetical protein